MEPQSPNPPQPPPAPAGAPPPSAWSQPIQPPAGGWTQQPAPGQQPGYPPPGYPPPGYPPPGYGAPIGAPPGMMWVQAKVPVTPLAKVGALFLVIVGALVTLAGLIVLVIGVLHILSGIGSWRGAGIARVLGIILGILFGLIALAGAAGGTTDTNGASTSSGVVGWVVAAGYIYTAAVLIFAWKQKPAA